MTERGLPLADGAPACPFVAFEDDRDERAAVPDHRHRCYADQRPAPRALAHQEAYCLSSAFPVCPTFQDWARREAARSRGGAATAPSASAGMNRAATGAVADAELEAELPGPGIARAGATQGSGGAVAGSAAIAATGGAAGPTGSAGEMMSDDGGPEPDDAVDPDDDAADPRSSNDPSMGFGDDQARRNPPRDWAAPPPWLASDESRSAMDAEPPSFLVHRTSDPGRGLAGSPADLLAGGQQPPPRRDNPDDTNWSSESRSAAAVGAGLASATAGPPARREAPASLEDEDGGDPGEARVVRRPRAYAQHLGGPDGPDWERPRRYEAYPVIKSRVGMPRMPGMPAIPRTLGLFGIVILAAIAVFFLPSFLNLGGSKPSPTGSAAASPRPASSASVAPTIAPAPSPVVYTIKKGDVLSKIAKSHGITIEELMAANPTIKDPNKISLGQQIIIPAPSAPPQDTVGDSAAP